MIEAEIPRNTTIIASKAVEAGPKAPREARSFVGEQVEVFRGTPLNRAAEIISHVFPIPAVQRLASHLRPDLTDDMITWTSEAATNAAFHGNEGQGNINVRFGVVTNPITHRRRLLVAVEDTKPSVGSGSNDIEHGRGETVMNALAQREGVAIGSEGKVVWGEFRPTRPVRDRIRTPLHLRAKAA